MPIPDIDQGFTVPTALPHPSDGPFAKERHENQDFRHSVAQKQINKDSCKFVPGSGPPGEEATYES